MFLLGVLLDTSLLTTSWLLPAMDMTLASLDDSFYLSYMYMFDLYRKLSNLFSISVSLYSSLVLV